MSGAHGSLRTRAERAALSGIALGLALLFLPLGPGAFRLGFLVVLGSTVAEIVCSHLRSGEP
jgi:hypothetical protein